jgi:hypothetical protein
MLFEWHSSVVESRLELRCLRVGRGGVRVRVRVEG